MAKEGTITRQPDEVPTKNVVNKSVEELFEDAKRVIADPNFYEGQSFTVSELWAGWYWRRIPKITRIYLGSYFNSRHKELDVEYGGLLSSNSMLYYKRTKGVQ